MFVPSWFTIDLRLGRPVICLEYTDYYNAWVYMENDHERKNLGNEIGKIIHTLQNLKSQYRNNPKFPEIVESQNLPENLHFWYSSPTCKTLSNTPRWWENFDDNDKTVQKQNPPKAHFYLRDKKLEKEDLEKDENDCLDLPPNDKLSSTDTCLIRKISHHVFKKIEMHPENITEDEAFNYYFITCNGKRLAATDDLRTVNKRIWYPTRRNEPIFYYEKRPNARIPIGR